ncbi:MAG: electron transfer flavoprotein subunit alpha/FixB family protein, partial [Desulfobacterales bacterium]|nr:electron transfer flavoprotein subunit alpha/FixB family protein [Desulfobacterales bacterium]
VTGICGYDTGLIFDRPVMDNTKIQSVHLSGSQSCVLTLVPGSIGTGHFPENAGEKGTVSARHVSVESSAVRRRELTGPQESDAEDTEDIGGPDIRTAPIVVGAGQGIGEPENLAKVFALAGRLPGAAVGASRPLVDRGVMPYHRQVGITGAVISPDLYIACGISGSSQHLAGMAGAKWVVSINTSADAPICRHADFCIQADVTEFISAFLDDE